MKENDNRFDWPNSNGGECPLCGFSCSASSTPDDVFGADIECNDCSFSCSDADLTKAKYKTDLATGTGPFDAWRNLPPTTSGTK